jgi:hypothetical protein
MAPGNAPIASMKHNGGEPPQYTTQAIVGTVPMGQLPSRQRSTSNCEKLEHNHSPNADQHHLPKATCPKTDMRSGPQLLRSVTPCEAEPSSLPTHRHGVVCVNATRNGNGSSASTEKASVAVVLLRVWYDRCGYDCSARHQRPKLGIHIDCADPVHLKRSA